ncbi:Acetyl-coenzyme A synthetase (EC, partial [uncultured Gammaproteobacteria bacterium]
SGQLPLLIKSNSHRVCQRPVAVRLCVVSYARFAENDCDNLGDISTLAEPEVVDDLILNRI